MPEETRARWNKTVQPHGSLTQEGPSWCLTQEKVLLWGNKSDHCSTLLPSLNSINVKKLFFQQIYCSMFKKTLWTLKKITKMARFLSQSVNQSFWSNGYLISDWDKSVQNSGFAGCQSSCHQPIHQLLAGIHKSKLNWQLKPAVSVKKIIKSLFLLYDICLLNWLGSFCNLTGIQFIAALTFEIRSDWRFFWNMSIFSSES